MTIPPIPPMPPEPLPEQPPRGTTTSSKKAKLQGALAAIVVVVLISSMIGIGGVITGLLFAPLVAFFGVILGSILTIFEHIRPFALGLLIASAILIFVTAGVCTVAMVTPLRSA
jgi:hypothetical protein